MARIRVIKPEFFKSEEVGGLPPITRVLYIGLWCYADKAGRLEYRPQYLKIEILPYDEVDMVNELELLCTPKARTGIPFIIKYEVDGIPYLQIVQWTTHQYLHKSNEAESTLPQPPDEVLERISNGRTTIAQRLKSGSTMAYEGRERKGREGKGKRRTPHLSSAFLVIDYLNNKTNSKYRPVAANTDGICDRMIEGYTVEDCHKVIDNKAEQWLEDAKMVKFLNPITLFRQGKFDVYLNEPSKKAKARRGE